jgi:uncharacterized protein involved in high-affinity Fe2+ transport
MSIGGYVNQQTQDYEVNSAPPLVKSEEATPAQLKLGQRQGETYGKALQAMDKESGADIQRAGDYEIAFVAEKAEGMWYQRDGQMHWMEPGAHNIHFEVAVRDAADGRFLPGLTVTISVWSEGGERIGVGELPFVWHPWLFHYGQNWRIPGDGKYRIQVRVDPPTFHRHDKQNGNRYSQPAQVEFVRELSTGQKTA